MNHLLEVSCLFLLCRKVNSRSWDLLALGLWAEAHVGRWCWPRSDQKLSRTSFGTAELQRESLWVQQVTGFCFAGCFVGEQLLWICKGKCTCVLSPWTISSFQLCSWAKINGRGRLLLCELNQLCVGGFESQSFAKATVFVLLLTRLSWTSPVFEGFLLLNWGLSLQQTALARGVTLAEELSLKLLQLLPYPCAVCLRPGTEPLLNFRIQKPGLWHIQLAYLCVCGYDLD